MHAAATCSLLPQASAAFPCSTSGAASRAGSCPVARPAPGRGALLTRRSWQTDRERELGRNVPPAPPARAPPPPPPPPPPPTAEPVVENELKNLSRRSLFGAVLGGTALLYAALRGGYPLSAVDSEKNVALLKTKGGNMVAATQDPSGRVFMFDRAGNLYYDTEDPRTGMLIVDTQGEMINVFVDKDGKVNRVPIGNIADLRTVTVKEIGGVPVQELQRSIKGLRGGRVTGFFDLADPSNPGDVSTSKLPSVPTIDGLRVGPPQILEDWEVELQPKGGGGLFGGGQPSSRDDLSTLRSLQRGDK